MAPGTSCSYYYYYYYYFGETAEATTLLVLDGRRLEHSRSLCQQLGHSTVMCDGVDI